MMKEILVLGSGMVGSTIAADLSDKHSVTAADKDEYKLIKLKNTYPVKTLKLDIFNKQALTNELGDYDLIVSAVPGFMGYTILKSIIESGKDVVDISFFVEDPFDLNDLALSNNVTAVVDCGVAPGLSNIILGYHYAKEKIRSFKCFVGGLPFARVYPFQYKAPFSPSDVIEEYTRPARIKENNVIVTKPALSQPELLNFNKIGTLEAFNSDGLRSLLKTLDIPDMSEKTLRYPGHLDVIRILRDAGFFSTEDVIVKDIKVKPADLTSKLLFDSWKLGDDEDEFTILLINIETEERGEISYFLFDVRDKQTGFSSMARTTGFTCTAVVNLLAEERIRRKGICPPEYLGMDEGNYEYVLKYLAERNILLEKL